MIIDVVLPSTPTIDIDDISPVSLTEVIMVSGPIVDVVTPPPTGPTEIVMNSDPAIDTPHILVSTTEVFVPPSPVIDAYGSPIGAPGPPGPQGPPGPEGPTGPTGGVYHHFQATASTSWFIVHNLSFYPNVVVVDSSHREIWPSEVDYTSSTSVTLLFSAAVAGEAFLS